MSDADVRQAASQEAGAYVNDVRYARLLALWQQATGPQVPGTAHADGAVEELLYREARLLDEQHHDAWLEQFTEECMVWVPAQVVPADPRLATGIYLDDRRRMADRVAMIRSGHLHAQTPASRTRRMLSNLEQWVDPETGSLIARVNLVIWEHRKAQTRAWPGYQVYEVERTTDAPLRIANKIICLLERDAPQGNYSFIL